MPASSFPEYVHEISRALEIVLDSGCGRVVDLQVDSRSAMRGFIAAKAQFSDDSELYVREFIDVTQPEPRLMYAYHYQSSQKALIFRYDNATHRPPLPQPEHKHTPSGTVTAYPPTLFAVLSEVIGRL